MISPVKGRFTESWERSVGTQVKTETQRITKADREARKSEDLSNGTSQQKSRWKCVTDITEIPAKDGKLYVSAIFDCYDLGVIGLAMSDNMKAELCVSTIKNACITYPGIRGAIIHSDYTEFGIILTAGANIRAALTVQNSSTTDHSEYE